MAYSAKPSITAVQQPRGQTVGVTQKEERGISLPQVPPWSYGWLEWREPEDLTNGILVSLLNVFISTLTIFAPVPDCSHNWHPTCVGHFYSSLQFVVVFTLALRSPMAHFSFWTSMEALSAAALRYGAWLEYKFCKSHPLCFTTASQGMCRKASLLNSHTVRNVYRQQHPSWGFCGWVGRRVFGWVGWGRGYSHWASVYLCRISQRNWLEMTGVSLQPLPNMSHSLALCCI